MEIEAQHAGNLFVNIESESKSFASVAFFLVALVSLPRPASLAPVVRTCSSVPLAVLPGLALVVRAVALAVALAVVLVVPLHSFSALRKGLLRLFQEVVIEQVPNLLQLNLNCYFREVVTIFWTLLPRRICLRIIRLSLTTSI